MRVLKVIDEHSNEELKHHIRKYKGYNDVIDWKIIQSVKMNPGIDAKTIAQVLCISLQKVYAVIEEYNKNGKHFKQDTHWGGRRKENSYLSFEEEEAFLEQLMQKAAKGLILTAKDIKEEIENITKHSVSEDYIWKIFKKHNWTKKAPRPEHPKTDYEKQDEFKKNSLRTWQPPS
jgi:transposase